MPNQKFDGIASQEFSYPAISVLLLFVMYPLNFEQFLLFEPVLCKMSIFMKKYDTEILSYIKYILNFTELQVCYFIMMLISEHHTV